MKCEVYLLSSYSIDRQITILHSCFSAQRRADLMTDLLSLNSKATELSGEGGSLSKFTR